MRASPMIELAVAALAVLAAAESAGQTDIPAALEPWRDWVLHGEDYRACPVLNGAMPGRPEAHVCAWPGELAIAVGDDGATFSQPWRVDAPDWLPLPGSAAQWPAEVRLDGEPAAVVERGGRPVVRVAAGTHELAGRLSWTQRPASIAIGPDTALVSLRLDGTPIARPRLERGTLWLGLAAQAPVEEDRLAIAVYRLLGDGLPIRLVTEVQLDVAGQSREIALTGALPPGFVGERLESALPAQLDAGGTLRVQVRPGDWTVRLAAHAADFLTAVAVPEAAAPWPAEEIWSYAADTRLRVAVLEGADPIDSRAADVPPDWQGYPSYRVVAGTTLDLTERSRNDADEPNRFSLDRQLWLDFAGDGFTALDAVRGEMSSGWRLDMAAPYVMTMATFDLGDPAPANNLLITEGGAPDVAGVELREDNVDLAVTARLETRGAVPVTGYLDAFDDVRTVLHLPPGHRLMAAPGADAVLGAWLNDWRLLDLFLALIVATATWRLLGIGPGILAAVTMVLVVHEPAAPRWLWLNLPIAIGLLRVAPQGRLRRAARLYRGVSLAALVLALIPFTVAELRTAVYPQLERARLERGLPAPALDNLVAGVPSAEDAARAPQSVQSLGATARLEDIAVTAREPEPDVSRYLPGALVQTGPGLPDWAWHRATLRWTSPVEPGQTYRLLIFGRWTLAAWRVASVLGALALLWLLARPGLRLPSGLLRRGGAAAGVATAVMLAVPTPGEAQTPGEFPSPALLEELKARLTEPAPCHPACAELTRAAVRVSGDTLTIDLDLANQADVAVPLPGTVAGWRAEAVAVDGAAVERLHASADGRYWLPLVAGVHGVRLSGLLPAANSVTIPFPLAPRRVTADAPGWDVTGIAESRLPSGTLELVRQQQGEPGELLGATEFPPYVRVTRALRIGLEWLVTTTVERVAPSDAGFTLGIPLLEDEAVLTPDVEVAGGIATVAFAAGQPAVSWDSRLPEVTSLTLSAAEDAPWTEQWLVAIGPLWHAEIGGVARVPADGADDWLEYRPRPGETLTVDVTRPAPAGGDTIAIDTVDHVASVGQRLVQSTLAFSYRSTRAEQHVITLPADSALDGVTIDGEPVPLRLDGQRLELPVTTGEHDVEIAWRNAREVGALTRLDHVDLGAGASNLRSSLRLPQDRWVLYAFGPPLGSAVLYWSELLVLALAAVALGRLALSPLGTHEWLLLGLGLSTFAWPTLLLFAVWAFAMSWRGRAELALRDRWFNALQAALGVLTLAALVALLGAIPIGLLGAPDMQIVSPAGGGLLSWFVDRSAGLTPSAGAISVSLWLYRAAMLAWALWLSFALLRWLPWAWRAYGHGGLWRGRVKTAA